MLRWLRAASLGDCAVPLSAEEGAPEGRVQRCLGGGGHAAGLRVRAEPEGQGEGACCRRATRCPPPGLVLGSGRSPRRSARRGRSRRTGGGSALQLGLLQQLAAEKPLGSLSSGICGQSGTRVAIAAGEAPGLVHMKARETAQHPAGPRTPPFPAGGASHPPALRRLLARALVPCKTCRMAAGLAVLLPKEARVSDRPEASMRGPGVSPWAQLLCADGRVAASLVVAQVTVPLHRHRSSGA